MSGLPSNSDPCARFARLLEIVARLRSDTGCPWDREQTPESLKRYVLEEAYEVCEAIDQAEPEHVAEELGDLLLQILLQAQIGVEREQFDIGLVMEGLAEKLVRRHPWVFGEAQAASPEDAVHQWEELKRAERKDAPPRLLSHELPPGLPALMKAQRVQGKASHVGFDWDRPEDALEKVREETREVERALKGDESPAALEEELGDLLFAVVNVARLAGVEAEQALVAATNKFCTRFAALTQTAREQGKSVETMTLAEMDALWEAQKQGG